jgi:hypothetical protein
LQKDKEGTILNESYSCARFHEEKKLAPTYALELTVRSRNGGVPTEVEELPVPRQKAASSRMEYDKLPEALGEKGLVGHLI